VTKVHCREKTAGIPIVYFESLTLLNLFPALLLLISGRQVHYFEVGRLSRRVPVLSRIMIKPFQRARYQVSAFPGLSLEIHEASLNAAEVIYQELFSQNATSLNYWSKQFHSQRVHLYVKNILADEAWKFIRYYLVLLRTIQSEQRPARFMVLDTPLNRLLLPSLLSQYPESRLEVRGISRFPWQILQNLVVSPFSTLEFFARLMALMRRRRFTIRSDTSHYQVAKEILWEIGTGRRNDDFFVDGDLIKPKDVLFYYQSASEANGRLRPGHLKISISNATAKGYTCISFDAAPVSLSLIRRIIMPRYVLFPLVIGIITLIRHVGRPSANLLNIIVMTFLARTVQWEIFLESFHPRLNVSQEDPYPHHIADTIALNLHGSSNGGFQWADDAQWRAVPLAYLGYNVYFSWGTLAKNYWKGNWEVDHIFPVGYLWGHHVQESLDQRDELRRELLGEGEETRLVVSLLDEKITPDLFTSETMLFDFYRVGVELLKKRPDITIIAKPKRWSDQDIGAPAILDMIAPYVESGRFFMLGRENVDVQQTIAISDVVISMVMGVPYLEAICCGRQGLNFAPTRNLSSPLYRQGYGKVVFDEVDDLVQAVESALANPQNNPGEGLGSLMQEVDPYCDLHGIDRMRQRIFEITDGGKSSPEFEACSAVSSESP
jgi:hypothetical protein